MRKELERIEIPGEHEARERSWAVVRSAFAEREPTAAATVVEAGRCDRAGARRRRGAPEPARPRSPRRDPRGRRGRAGAAGALLAAGSGSAARLSRLRAPGSSSATARSGCSAAIAKHPGRRSAASSSRPGRTSSWRSSRTATSAGRSRGRTCASRAGAARAPTRGSRTSRTAGSASSPATARATACSIRRPRTGRPRWLSGPGHRLAYARRDGSIRVVDVDTRAVLDRDAPSALEESAVPKVSLRGIDAGARRRRCSRPTAAGRLSAGPTLISSSSRTTRGRGQIRAVSNVAAQFRSRTFPTISGWCCAVGVDSADVLAGRRLGDGARGAARGRAGAPPLLPLRLVADLNAGAAAPA